MLNIVLVEPEIPPNTGNIGRLCLSTGTRLHLVEPLGFTIDDKTLKRAGLDYWKDVDCHRWPDFEAVRSAADADAQFYFFTTKCQHRYWDVEFRDGDYLVFGPETRGLPAGLLAANALNCVTIPQTAGRSLNLATSAGIALYEALRQLDVQSSPRRL